MKHVLLLTFNLLFDICLYRYIYTDFFQWAPQNEDLEIFSRFLIYRENVFFRRLFLFGFF